jgi:hypothetical protein
VPLYDRVSFLDESITENIEYHCLCLPICVMIAAAIC